MNPQDERPSEAVAFVPLANSVEFCQALLDDVEWAFRRQFGTKWTPEAQQVFQDLRSTCIVTAQRADAGFETNELRGLRQPVLLSNNLRRG